MRDNNILSSINLSTYIKHTNKIHSKISFLNPQHTTQNDYYIKIQGKKTEVFKVHFTNIDVQREKNYLDFVYCLHFVLTSILPPLPKSP